MRVAAEGRRKPVRSVPATLGLSKSRKFAVVEIVCPVRLIRSLARSLVTSCS